MVFLRQWSLILFALVLGGGQLFATTREQRDFDAAAAAFHDGMWSRAEVQFAQFIEKHPDSALIAQAGLMQAQADVKQGKLLEAIAFLQAREASAGPLADQYAFWIGQAQLQNADYSAAADTFARLSITYPDSPSRLDAVVNEADSRARLNQWSQVQALLQKSGGSFQDAVRTNAADARILTGQLLLAKALLEQNHPGDAAAVLQSLGTIKSNPESNWRRLYMLCQARWADHDTNEALALTTNLIAMANHAGRADLSAQSVAEQADMLEKMGRLSDAVSVYQENLTNTVPNDLQRQAILKIAELSAEQTNFSDAESSLNDFLSRFPASPEADSVTLALGELRLKSYFARPSSTNDDLVQAQGYFDQFIGTFTNSPLLGKAYLDRGWSFWIQGRWPDSAADFQSATEKLPPSVDLAVAHFKLGDALFRQNDLAKARDNYEAVVNDFTNYPIVGKTLGAQALYQALRVCMDLKDVSGMSNATAQILRIYPVSNLAEKSILLDGEALSDLSQPSSARALFQKFEELSPNSEILPDVEIRIAQTYEQETNWPEAISVYNSWISRFSSNTGTLPSVEYARAWANFQSGNETNAFLLFTNFVAQYTNNGLAQAAQYWIGDYYYGQGDWQDAERNYKLLYQTWPSSPLNFPAKLMAGRAAMGRQDYIGAIDYFTQLTGDPTNCPPDLDKLALFAYGDALMQMTSPDMSSTSNNFQQAITIFGIICGTYPDSPEAAHAWGEIGDCNFQLAALAQSYDQVSNYCGQATNAYAQVIGSPNAEIAARSQAQIGLGLVLEKFASLTNGTGQTALLQSAQNNYLDVFFGSNLRDGETADPFWVKKAGLQALALFGTLGTGDPNKFIDQMELLFPQMKDSLEKQRLEFTRLKGQ